MILRRLDPADPRDMVAAVALAKAMHAESPLHRERDFDHAKVRDLIYSACANPDWLPLIGWRNGQAASMALVVCSEDFYGNDKYVSDLVFYVRPDHRGGTLAFRMLVEIEKWAKLAGANQLQIGIHTGINHAAAVRFFQGMGMEVRGLMVEKSL